MDFKEITDKIITDHAKLVEIVAMLKSNGQTVVTTNGCFDILHKGHILYLYESKQEGDKLILCLNSDTSVKRLKGDTRPINTFSDRAMVMASLFFVDYITMFDEDTPESILSMIKPDVHTKGGDYDVKLLPEYNIVRKNGGTTKIISYHDNYSTTNLIQKINNEHIHIK